jgi:hypothetical protein
MNSTNIRNKIRKTKLNFSIFVFMF